VVHAVAAHRRDLRRGHRPAEAHGGHPEEAHAGGRGAGRRGPPPHQEPRGRDLHLGGRVRQGPRADQAEPRARSVGRGRGGCCWPPPPTTTRTRRSTDRITPGSAGSGWAPSAGGGGGARRPGVLATRAFGSTMTSS